MEGKKSYRIAKRPLYREEIKEALMEAIVSGELAPGERIVETRWAKELGVSQSPIREAIRELEMDSELDDDVPHYSIDFKSGNLEYEYEISATDGSVLKFEQDN